MNKDDLFDQPHTRLNILTGERVLVSPHRTRRPWMGKLESHNVSSLPKYEAGCYLCPGNKRADGDLNPVFDEPFSFTNDFAALLPNTPERSESIEDLLITSSEKGTCRVIVFSPDHSQTLPLLNVHAIEKIIALWQQEFHELSTDRSIKYIQIFENKGEIMGCSNPHPHGQIWASSSIPVELEKETREQKKYFEKKGKSLVSDYIKLELKLGERVVLENEHFVAIVPFWAVWPYETLVTSKRHLRTILELTKEEKKAFASILKKLLLKYDSLFGVSFPYSSGIHQSPVNDGRHPEWHWHMHFYPPLLRSASIKKFMVGYEMLATPQRDISAEQAAETLRAMPEGTIETRGSHAEKQNNETIQT